MILSRTKSDSAKSQRNSGSAKIKKRQIPTFEEFLQRRDYVGAKTVMKYSKDYDDEEETEKNLWMSYCDFHLGDYRKCLDEYEKVYDGNRDQKDIGLNIGVCMFMLGMYDEAQKTIENLPESPLKIRLLFHLAHKLGDDDRLMELHSSLRDVIEDQVSLAGLHYLRGQYQEAIDIYKRILLDNKNLLAVNVYVALCYYKLDYFGMSQEVLDLYLVNFPDSTIAANLKACNRFRMFNGQAAEQDIKHLLDNGIFGTDLIKHNLVVFRNGESALQILPQLLDIVPEARLNLAIHHLKRNEVHEAHQMIKDVQPKVPHEYILKGVVHACMFQETGSKEHAKQSQQYLHLVGGSATECDTIPGRQSMASSFFLYGQFEEVLVYLNSIRSFFINDDTFNYNYAQAKVATGYYKEAEELLMQIHSMQIRSDHTFSMILARCHIHCGHADQAWNIFVTKDTTPEAFSLLQLIANDCYRIGEFWIAAKAFDMLEKMDPNPEHWEGKRGACAGALYNIIAKKKTGQPPNGIGEIISLLRDSSNSQAEPMLRAFRRYASSSK
ncbi:unnamed protein product [Diamesa hyperborea]